MGCIFARFSETGENTKAVREVSNFLNSPFFPQGEYPQIVIFKNLLHKRKRDGHADKHNGNGRRKRYQKVVGRASGIF